MNRVVGWILWIINFDHAADRERERKYREISNTVDDVVEEHDKTMVTAIGVLDKKKPLSIAK
jgi:hypothetical protein